MIKLERITKTYVSKKGIKTLAVDDVSLRLAGLGLVFVVGKSGCGKTTLLNLIGGMDKADSGKTIVNDEDIAGFDERALDDYRNDRVGFVFQEYQLLDNLTAGENVGLALWLQGKKAEGDKIAELFARLDLAGEQDKLTSEMSGGQKQRVAIARALIKNPRIILADEPTGALDSKTGQEIFKILKQISKDRLVIVVSHDIDSAEQFADRIIELSDGKITSDKTINNATSDNTINNATSEKTNQKTSDPTNQIADYKATCQARPAQAHKNRLSVKGVFKLGFVGMFERKIRLAVTLFLAAFALMFFGFFTTFVTYDRESVFVRTMYNDNNYFLSLTRSAVFTDSDLKRIADSLTGHSFVKYYNLNNSIFYVGSCENYEREPKTSLYQNNSFTNVLELDEGLEKSLKLRMVAGTYPSADNEVVLTDFIFSCFKEMGHKDYYTGESAKIEKYSDLIGKKIGSSDVYTQFGGFIVTGIVDSGFNYSKYAGLADDPRDLVGAWVGSSLDNDFGGMIHRTLFVNKGFGARFYERMNLTDTKIYGLKSPYSSASFVGGGSLYSISRLGSFPYTKLSSEAEDYTGGFPFGVVFKSGTRTDELEKDQIIACFDDLLKLTTTDGRQISSIFRQTTEELVLEFASENFDSVKSQLSQHYENATVEDYVEYILSTELENIYQNGKTLGYFQKEAKPIVARLLLDGLKEEVTIETTYYDSELENVSLAGIYFLEQSDEYRFMPTTFIADELFSKLELMYSDFNNYHIYVSLTGNLKKDVELVKKLGIYSSDNLTDDYNNQKPALYYYNETIDGIYKSETILGKLTIVFVILSTLLAVVAFVMIFNYFSSLIMDESKKVGILRALGAKKADIFWLYYLKSLAIVLFTAIVSTLGVLLCITIANAMLDSKFHLAFTLLGFSLIQPLAVLILSIATVTLASLIPIKKITSKPPVKAMG